MNGKRYDKQQTKKSTGRRFEVTPVKSPPHTRRLQPIHNLDGSLLFPKDVSKIPYKLRKDNVSGTKENNKCRMFMY